MFWNKKKPEEGRVCLQRIKDYVLNIRYEEGDYGRCVADFLEPIDMNMYPAYISNPQDYVRLGLSKQGDDVYVLKSRESQARETMKIRGCDSCFLKERDHILFEYAKK